MAREQVPFIVQIEMLALIAEHEDFEKSASALKVIGPAEIRQTLKGIVSFLRTAQETGAYEADDSNVLTDKVKDTLAHLSETEQDQLFDSFGLGDDDE